MHPPRWSLAIILPLVAVASGQQCYWPNGNDARLAACPVANGSEAAACCFAGHYCMSNGVCFSNTELSFYRGGCTAKDWATSGCPKYCDKESIADGVLNAHAGLNKCSDGQYACQSTSNCASDSFEVPAGIMLPNIYLRSDLGILATATTAGTPASTGTASVTATCSSTAAAAASASSGGISTGAAAGIGVGVGVPLALAVVLLTVLLLREKKKTRAALPTPAYHENAPTSPWAKSERTGYAPVEIQTQAPPPELPNDYRGRHKLS